MSPTVLSKRLQQLTRAGVIERTDNGRYVLTAAGEVEGAAAPGSAELVRAVTSAAVPRP
jgi:Mn-dependent DtxR family transcriptional regulator